MVAIEEHDNELLALEVIHRFVEMLDTHFGTVCELDIIFNFEKAYFVLDELLLAGELQESSQEEAMSAVRGADEEAEIIIFED